MSLAKKEEVCSHRPVPRLGELTVGVPIKKRPVSFSDKSAASGMPFSMKPSSPEPEMSVSAAGAGCGKESFFNIAKPDANVITKGKGITTSQIQDHVNRPLTTLSMTNSNRVLFNESSETPCAESDSSVAPVDKSHRQKFMVLDLELASHRNGKNNSGSVVKEEKVDHGFSGFSSVQHPKNVQIASEINASSNSNFAKLPNLDLNVPLDPADSLEGLPTMHENGNGLYHRTIQYQESQVPPAAPISTISSGLGRNIDSTLNLSNSDGLSHKCGAADVTLDLQLKPPARPELGINWKGLAPAPELSLSLFGKPMDGPNAFSAPNALFNSEPAGSSKKVSDEAAATLGSDKTPVEKTVTLVPCNAYPRNTTSSIVSGIDKMVSNSLVKKEPEEPSQQNILKDAEQVHLLRRQSVGLANNCAEPEKTDSVPQVSSKTGFDLNSDIFPNNSIHNGLDIMTDNVPIPAESLPAIVRTEGLPAVPEVEKSVKREESMSAIPSPVAATVDGHSVTLMAEKSLPLESNVVSTAVGLCESSSQLSISTFEASCSKTVNEPPGSRTHAHSNTRRSPCEALPSSSNPRAEHLVFNSQDHATIDGMSQGSAEMDCSDDDYNTVSRFPATNKHHCEPSGNGPTTEDGINANNLCKELKKEHDSDTHQDCSSLTNKFSMECLDNDKSAKIRAGVVSHAGDQGRQVEVFVNEKSKDKQLLKSDKNSLANDTDNSMHDVKTATGSSSTDLQRSSALQKSTRQSSKTSDSCLGKTISPEIKPERSPNCNQAASCGEDHAKNAVVKTEHQIESEEVTRQSDLRPRDSVLGEDSELDGASSSQPHSESGKVKSESEKSEYDKSKPDSCKTSSAQNETNGQLVGSHWRDLGHAYVNRNERWERFMESEREKNKGEYHGGRDAYDMINQRMTNHCYGGRGAGSCGHPRNFRGPRMSNEFTDEPISGRRRPFEDDLGHLHGMPRRSPLPGFLMRETDIDGFHGRNIPDPRLLTRGHMEDLPDDMMEERFFMPHSHRHLAQGDRGFIHRERSHSPAQRRGAPVHFHRGCSPEAMHRSPPLMRAERRLVPHRHHTRRHGSPLDQMGHDERGMQRNMRMLHQALEGDGFKPHLHPAHLAELHAEDELVDRRKYRDRRGYLRSLEVAPVREEDEMLSYHTEDDMEFAEGGDPREHNGRFRNRLVHRARGEREDGYRHRGGPQGWRDGDSNDNRPKRRRY